MERPDFDQFENQIDEKVFARIWWVYDPPPPYVMKHIKIQDQVALYATALQAKAELHRIQEQFVNQQLEILNKYRG